MSLTKEEWHQLEPFERDVCNVYRRVNSHQSRVITAMFEEVAKHRHQRELLRQQISDFYKKSAADG